ncbi:MAG: SDR family NAD(P)-dependent oxidoreductase [Coraliomargaritaceae bacterium]
MKALNQKYKRALVTGSSAGIGLALSKMLLNEGVAVIGMSRQPDRAIDDSRYHPVPFDLSDTSGLPNKMNAILKAFPDIDLIINNAGFGIVNRLEEADPEEVLEQYAVMLEAPTLIAGLAIRHFKKRGIGCLLNISSLASEIPIPLMPVYNASKAGLSALSDSLMLDAEGDHACYSVIDVRPGDFKTEFASRMKGEADWNGVDLRAILDRHHAEAPEVSSVINPILKALYDGKNRRLRVGTFFQTVVGSLGARVLPGSIGRWLIRDYYKK